MSVVLRALRGALARVPHALWQAGFWGAALVLLVLALMPVPAHFVWVPYVDKIEHAVSFLVLMALGQLAGITPRWRLALGLLGFGIAIELVQALTSWRQGDVTDALADALGIALGLLLPPLPGLVLRAQVDSAQPGKNGR